MLNLQETLIAVQVVVSLVVLLYASWRDYVCREVSNKVWAIYAPIALAVSLVELLFFDISQLPLYGLSVGVTVAIAFLLFYAGGFGGADSKALMCLAMALPFAPLLILVPLFPNGASPTSQVIFPITVFGNGVLFAAASAVYMVLRNVAWHRRHGVKMFTGNLASESMGKKILVLLTGYKMAVTTLKAKWHVFPMEDIEDGQELKRKLVVVPHEDGREKIVERLDKAVEEKKIEGFVWATPGLPMLIFLTAGLVVALFFGDLVWLLVRLVLS